MSIHAIDPTQNPFCKFQRFKVLKNDHFPHIIIRNTGVYLKSMGEPPLGGKLTVYVIGQTHETF